MSNFEQIVILARAGAARRGARIAGVFVQPMIVRPRARELIAGIADDPTFGLALQMPAVTGSDMLLGKRRKAKTDHLVERRFRILLIFHD